MDLRLRDHLAKLFNEQKKSKKDVRENHRAMAKLLKEAQRLKTVLSANIEFMAQVRLALPLLTVMLSTQDECNAVKQYVCFFFFVFFVSGGGSDG